MKRQTRRTIIVLWTLLLLMASFSICAEASGAGTVYYRIATTKTIGKYRSSTRYCYSKKLTLGKKSISVYGRVYKASSRRGAGKLSKLRTYTFRLNSKTRYYYAEGVGVPRITRAQMFRALRSFRRRNERNTFVIAVRKRLVKAVYASS